MRLTTVSSFGVAMVSLFGTLASAAWNKSASNNVVVYWGQNGMGSLSQDKSKQQKDLIQYCQKPEIDLIPIGFLHNWTDSSTLPLVNFSNSCTGWQKFPGTDLLWCPSISRDIITCQKTYGKKILLSIGGGAGPYQGWNTTEGKLMAEKIWNMFGGGWAYYRPFGEAVIDGFDLNLEYGSGAGYEQFAWRLRQLMDGDQAKTGKEWILTAAPQCPHPDSHIDNSIKGTAFDAIFVQFYNNPACQANTWALGKEQTSGKSFNFGQWHNFATTTARNKKMKVFLTLPLAGEIGTGYVSRTVAAKIIGDLKRYSSFGGFAGWDASIAEQNTGYTAAMKNALGPTKVTKRASGTKQFHNHHNRH